MAIRKFIDVMGKSPQADLMILTNKAALQKRPKTLDGIGVNVASHIPNGVVYGFVGHEAFDPQVAFVLVRVECGTLRIYIAAHQSGQILGGQRLARHRLCFDFPATLDHSDDRHFLSTTSALWRVVIVFLALAWLATKKTFVHFDHALKQFALLNHGLAYPHSHVPSGIPVNFKVTGELPSGDAFLGVQNQRNGEKPFLKIDLRLVEDRAYGDAVGGIAVIAMMAMLFGHRAGIGRVAIRTDGRSLPADLFKIDDAVILGREPFIYLYDIHGFSGSSLPLIVTLYAAHQKSQDLFSTFS